MVAKAITLTKEDKLNKELYDKRKVLGLCPRCGSKPSRGVFCDKCKERAREHKYKSIMRMDDKQYKEHRENDCFNHNYLYILRKKEGLCTYCGVKKVRDKQYVNCYACRKKRREKAKTLRKVRENEAREIMAL